MKHLSAQGFHRIGRIDAEGRRSLWLREESGAIELRAGREGDDVTVRITADNPLYEELCTLFAAARFAAEWSATDGTALDDSYDLDTCEASIHRRRS